jgi:NCAIR mutase (PurE)-related protein
VNPDLLRALLARVREGDVTIEAALEELRGLPYRELGFATIDHHRHVRRGFAEVVFGQGKTAEQIIGILNELVRGGGNCLVTRIDPERAEKVCAVVPGARHEVAARAVVVEQRPFEDLGRGVVLIVSAGTSDIPVAEEAALTARLMGNRVERLFDVGVAGIHRILGRRDALESAEIIIVCAGMEGALASVVGGLVSRPVIAVPTSIGYGTSFGGVTALLGMLNSCSSGVTVVNIDNGFGAGFAAALINRKTGRESTAARES